MNPGNCPICGNSDQYKILYEIDNGKRKVLRCSCSHQLICPRPTEEDRLKIYDDNEYYTSWGVKEQFQQIFDLKLKTCSRLVGIADKYVASSKNKKRLLDIGCAFGYMLEAAGRYGYEPHGLEISSAADEALRMGYSVQKTALEDAVFPAGYFDLITGIDIIEHIPYPEKWLSECKSLLKKGGILLLVTPNCESLPARMKKNKWHHYNIEHLHYYSPNTIERLFKKAGFEVITTRKAIKYFSLEYLTNLYGRFRSDSVETKFLKTLRNLVPQSFFQYPMPFHSGMLAIGRKK